MDADGVVSIAGGKHAILAGLVTARILAQQTTVSNQN